MPDATTTPRSLHTVARTDGMEIHGDYSFMVADHEDDWTSAETDAEYRDEPVDYELVTWHAVKVQTRTFNPDEPCTEWQGSVIPAEDWWEIVATSPDSNTWPATGEAVLARFDSQLDALEAKIDLGDRVTIAMPYGGHHDLITVPAERIEVRPRHRDEWVPVCTHCARRREDHEHA